MNPATVPRRAADRPAGAIAPTDASAPQDLESRLEGLGARARKQLREARRLIDARRGDAAAAALEQARGQAENHPEFLRLLGIARHLEKRHAEAVALLRRALELRPRDAVIMTNLGFALRGNGDLRPALVALQQACELDPKLTAAWLNLARTLAMAARPREAIEAYQRALECEPEHIAARVGYADALRVLGRIEEAAAELRRVLDRNPASVGAWNSLASLRTHVFTEQDVVALERLRADARLSESDRVRVGFALAKALEDQRRYDEAFVVLTAANAMQRRRVKWDAPTATRVIESIMKAFEIPPKGANAAKLGHETLFIVSLPRSGSSLVEQILASHPDVTGAEELPDLGAIIERESTRRESEFPAWVGDATAADWRRLGQQYQERTSRWRAETPRFTDKGLANWQMIGAALAMLPAARFINVRRDPLETGLACYRQFFRRGQGFTYDLFDMGNYWRDYDRLMRFWHARYPHRIHDIAYEALIAEPEAQIRSLLAFCELPFDGACLRFYETQRDINTISGAQVREPLRNDTARAHLYGDLLAPLRVALGRTDAH
ncbi:MAG: sulfotransferase [Rhodanobacteraceae bacterium]